LVTRWKYWLEISPKEAESSRLVVGEGNPSTIVGHPKYSIHPIGTKLLKKMKTPIEKLERALQDLQQKPALQTQDLLENSSSS